MNLNLKSIALQGADVLIYTKTFWSKQKNSGGNQPSLFFGYFFPLVILVALGEFFGELITSVHFYAGYATLKFLRVIILYTLFYFISNFFTNELVKTFGGKKDASAVQKLVVYSLTPILLVSFISGLFQFFYVVNILGFYSLYIFWIGVPGLIELPQRNKSKYILTSILTNIFVFGFLSILLSKLLMAYL